MYYIEHKGAFQPFINFVWIVLRHIFKWNYNNTRFVREDVGLGATTNIWNNKLHSASHMHMNIYNVWSVADLQRRRRTITCDVSSFPWAIYSDISSLDTSREFVKAMMALFVNQTLPVSPLPYQPKVPPWLNITTKVINHIISCDLLIGLTQFKLSIPGICGCNLKLIFQIIS